MGQGERRGEGWTPPGGRGEKRGVRGEEEEGGEEGERGDRATSHIILALITIQDINI